MRKARRDRRLDAAWMEGVAACPRMKRGESQPGSWRADGFLRCVVWGTSFLHVCAFGRDGRVLRVCVRLVSHHACMGSLIFLQSLGGWSSGLLVLRVDTCMHCISSCRSSSRTTTTTIEHETRRHSTRLPRAPSQCYRWPLTQGGAHGGEYKVASVSQDWWT